MPCLDGVAAANEDAIHTQLWKRRDTIVELDDLLPPQRLHVEVHLCGDTELAVRCTSLTFRKGCAVGGLG